MKKYFLYLFLIIVIALLLRTIALSIRPLGFTWDEAALGYNAYSLLHTARDEHNQLFPVIFRSFGDYKPGLYIYLAVPWIGLLGLNEFSTRIASAVIGTLLVLTISLLTRHFYNKNISLAAGFLAAVNPWLIHFSRGAWEANVSLFLTLLGSLLFIRKKYAISAVFLGLTFWTYQGAKLFTPLIILSLLWIFRPASIRKITLPALILGLFIIPVAVNFSSQAGRLVVLGVFSYTRPVSVINHILAQDKLTSPDLLFNFFHAEFIDQTRGIIQRYLNHFSPQFLFLSGDWSNLRHTTPYFGYFYLPEVITLFIGFRYFARRFGLLEKLLILWLILSVIPSALSRDIVSGVRALPEAVPLIIISAVGLSRILKHKLVLFATFGLLGFFFLYYLDAYYILSPNYSAADWLYQYKPALEEIRPLVTAGDRVVMTSAMGQPYIFVLFYYQIDPLVTQEQLSGPVNQSVDVSEVTRLNQFEFRKFYWPAERNFHNVVYIGDQFELPAQDLFQPNLVRYPDINYPNGSLAWRVVELK